MGKLVVLKLGDGSFEQGFPATLQIGEEGKSPNVEITGRLPSTPDIPQHYSGWAAAYRRLGLRSRLEASKTQVTNVSKLELCSNAAAVIHDRLNSWLHSEPFRPIREKLLEQLLPSDEIRLIIQTENIWLQRLPWHLWDFCDRYPKAEIALSAPAYERVEQKAAPHDKVRILAILGNSTGIDIQADRRLLEQLPDAEVRFLVEPQLQELTEELWRQSWDILFFAGHSSSYGNGTTGRIYINQSDSLTIEQLKYGLRKAVERGLKIAIFNSCDGLGLAGNLADLHIPQIIVMREPVPDRVSQEFLKYFLEAFAWGESFYLAVREARERLQGLEDRFPCATWLPAICQNPAVIPPTWQELSGNPRNKPILDSRTPYSPDDFFSNVRRVPPRPIFGHRRRDLVVAFCISLVVTSLLVLVRQLGILQPWELQAFDYLMQKRPVEPPDDRLLVVMVTEEDIAAQQAELRPGTSLSDRSLDRLLQILQSHRARAIGLDIFRDFPVAAESQDLAKQMQRSPNLFTICQIANSPSNDPGIAPPPEIPVERQGFSNVVIDPTFNDPQGLNRKGMVRRHVLTMYPPASSPCTPGEALSTRLAFHYLATREKPILPEYTKHGHLQLGDAVFKRLKPPNTGGYQNFDFWGYQVLLNYRDHRSLQDFTDRLTLTQVLNGQFNPDRIKDRVVLVGVTAPSRNDYFLTPYSTQFDRELPGVFLHAQMVSQILSAVLDGRPLLWVLPWWGDVVWIWSWSLVGGLVVSWRFPFLLRLLLTVGALPILSGLCLNLLTQGGWMPLVPSALALVSTGGGVVAYQTFQTQRQQSTLAFKS